MKYYFIIFALLLSYTINYLMVNYIMPNETDIHTATTDKIISDYGNRDLGTREDWHKGVDYAINRHNQIFAHFKATINIKNPSVEIKQHMKK